MSDHLGANGDAPFLAALSDVQRMMLPAEKASPDAVTAFRRGQLVRITFEAEILATEMASGERGIACVRTRAGAGMNDNVWLVREPDFGEVINVEVIRDVEEDAT